MIDWRPIETAPRDRTVLLARSVIVCAGDWRPSLGCWGGFWAIMTRSGGKVDPTHWAPLNIPEDV